MVKKYWCTLHEKCYDIRETENIVHLNEFFKYVLIPLCTNIFLPIVHHITTKRCWQMTNAIGEERGVCVFVCAYVCECGGWL